MNELYYFSSMHITRCHLHIAIFSNLQVPSQFHRLVYREWSLSKSWIYRGMFHLVILIVKQFHIHLNHFPSCLGHHVHLSTFPDLLLSDMHQFSFHYHDIAQSTPSDQKEKKFKVFNKITQSRIKCQKTEFTYKLM